MEKKGHVHLDKASRDSYVFLMTEKPKAKAGETYPAVACKNCGHVLALLDPSEDLTEPFLADCPNCNQRHQYQPSEVRRAKAHLKQ